MLTVGIIGILAAIALPAYQSYLARARIAEGFELSAPVQKSVSDYYDRWGVLPDDNQAAGLPAPDLIRGNAVKGVRVLEGVILVQYENILNRKDSDLQYLVLRPGVTASQPTASITWVCQKAVAAEAMVLPPMLDMPSLIEDKHLPNVCRAST